MINACSASRHSPKEQPQAPSAHSWLSQHNPTPTARGRKRWNRTTKNHQGWKSPLRIQSPRVNPAPAACSPLNLVLRWNNQTLLEHFQGWGLHHWSCWEGTWALWGFVPGAFLQFVGMCSWSSLRANDVLYAEEMDATESNIFGWAGGKRRSRNVRKRSFHVSVITEMLVNGNSSFCSNADTR